LDRSDRAEEGARARRDALRTISTGLVRDPAGCGAPARPPRRARAPTKEATFDAGRREGHENRTPTAAVTVRAHRPTAPVRGSRPSPWGKSEKPCSVS
jgi:hypothetical protein